MGIAALCPSYGYDTTGPATRLVRRFFAKADLMSLTFDLHPQLAADCVVVGDLPLCRLLLMDDANYPWCILVPRRPGVREIHELTEADQRALLAEVSRLSATMQSTFAADKMNVAALGNVVPQLHVHVIARRIGDAAWPRPVWGAVPRRPYAEAERAGAIALLRRSLKPTSAPPS
jgi:diadenosine tetraphosphate (Ap4A) HIT family hydrolase